MTNELLPCPFCGGVPMIKYYEDGWPICIAQIICQNCNAKQSVEGHKPTYNQEWCLKKAYEQWNTRTAANPLTVERVVEALSLTPGTISMTYDAQRPYTIDAKLNLSVIRTALQKLLDK